MQDLPRSLRRTYRLDPVLAYVLSRMLATLPRVEALPHMQTDHHGVGFEAHIPLTFPIHAHFQSMGINVEMRSYTAI